MTALFCDIVGFVQFVANCKPSDVLAVLNTLYTEFDRLTRVHDTFRVRGLNNIMITWLLESIFTAQIVSAILNLLSFKVESVGDAYFVVSGTPESDSHHAERVANTALGMMLVGSEVESPLTGESVQVILTIN